MARRRGFTLAALVAVMLGGALGAGLRSLVVVPLGTVDEALLVPSITLGINLVGSLLLGVLVGWLAESRPLTRAFLGTGVLGGFTTYSAFAVQIAELGGAAPVVSLILAAASLFGGVLAAGVGLRVGHIVSHSRGRVEAPEAAE